MHLHFIATVRGHPASGLALRRAPPLALHGLFLLLLPPLRLLLTRAQAKACSDVRTTVVEASDAGSGGGSALPMIGAGDYCDRASAARKARDCVLGS